MKKIMILGFAMAIIIAGCKKKSDDSGTPTGCAMTADYTFVVDTVGHQVRFTNTSSAEAAIFSWNFGDGQTSAAMSPNHAYKDPGTFLVKLSIVSADGKCTGEVTKSVNVSLNSLALTQTYTTKVVMEEFTGAWCGYCTDGALIVDQIVAAKAGKVIGTSIHEGDPMEVTGLYTTLDATFDNSGFPSGMVNRVPYNGDVCMNRGYWNTVVNQQLAKVAKCGVAVNSSIYKTDSAKIEVQCSFNQNLTGTYNLSIYLVEDSVTGGSTYNQVNYYSSGQTNPAGGSSHYYYNFPNPIPGFKHMQVVRKALTTQVMGEAISSTYLKPNGRYASTKYIKIPATYVKSNLKIVAFVNKVGTSGTTHEIMNAVQVKLGKGKGWD